MIGPAIPSNLNRADDSDEEEGPQPSTSSAAVIGPQIPASLAAKAAPAEDEDEDEDSWAPSLPPDLAPPPPRVIGPSFPGPSSRSRYDHDSDDDYGPMPLPAGFQVEEDAGSGVREFIEREERRKKELEDSLKPKALKRDEWMLAPPKDSGLLTSLDPTKLKSRQFSRTTEEKSTVSTLWTETPAERQARLADETMGKRKRAEISAGGNAAPEETDDDRKRRRRDDEIRQQIDQHNKSKRGDRLLDLHRPEDSTTTSSSSKDLLANSKAIWDRDRDMSLGGRLMDDSARNKLIKDAKDLGSRFSASSKTGRFL